MLNRSNGLGLLTVLQKEIKCIAILDPMYVRGALQEAFGQTFVRGKNSANKLKKACFFLTCK